MPKKTFFNLSESRREIFLNVAFREFTIHNYDDASITAILKNLKIAKGSFYQYFDNKLDLFNYLIQISITTKQKYQIQVNREDFNSLWEYWRKLYEEGMKFDFEHPVMSNFNYCLSENMNSPSVRELFAQWQVVGFEKVKEIVLNEIKRGQIKDDIPIDTVTIFILNISRQILDQLKMKNNKDFMDRIEKGKSLLKGGNEKLFLQVVDDSIKLLELALNKE